MREVVGKARKKQAEARAKEIADAGAVDTAVSQSVQMAVLTAVIVPTVVTSS